MVRKTITAIVISGALAVAQVGAAEHLQPQDLPEYARASNLRAVEELLQLGTDPDVRGARGRTALMNAAEVGAVEIMNALIDRGADASLLDDQYENALTFATWKNHIGAVKVLLAAGVSLLPPPGGMAPLYRSAIAGRPEMVSLFIGAGADVHWADSFGKTAIFIAAANDQAETIKILHSAGADIDQQANDGSTAVMAAVKFERLRALKSLLELGAKPFTVDDEGGCAWNIALSKGNATVLDLLRSGGAESCSAAGQ